MPAAELRRNRWTFGLGTLGRDMLGALVSMYLMFYLTEVVGLTDAALASVTAIIVAMRIFDACNDPIMGVIVDNTRSRWGKFKPWIGVGALLWGASTIMLFVDSGKRGTTFLLIFGLTYLVWGVAYTINDISYWGMLPSLSRNQKERESIGVIARITANVGLFAVVVAVLPATAALGSALGGPKQGWLAFAAILVALMLVFQSLTLLFTREQVTAARQHTPLRELLRVIGGNDQLLVTAVAMLVFMTGYTTTASLGIYYFKYIHGEEGAYPVFAAILGVAQLIGLGLFPLLAKRFARRQIHTLATSLCLGGLGVFWLAGSSMPLIGLAGVLLFGGQAFIQLLMLMFIADCVEYGEWKLGRRNESVTVSLQPFIYKASNALASGLVGVSLVWSGINQASSAAEVSETGKTIFKVVMLVVPMVLVSASWLVLRTWFRIDEKRYAGIVTELEERRG
ncbi:MAG: glycoside-pentoside-hexuronide (GPH):cation symporter [Propionibacteriaceae bacterium]|nr:glycoside-pentoside-hexuronide (GPH):cation symporter [Propionibacteriaceae bacterium]